MIKPFLLLQTRPEDDASFNEYKAFLKFGNLEENDLVRMRIEKTGITEKINLDNFSGIILGGGPLCVSNETKNKFEKKMEKDLYNLLDEVVKKDFPFLGVCLGIGILGKHQSCQISKDSYSEAVGSMEIFKTQAGSSDSLLKGVTDKFKAFGGHKEACQKLSDNAVLLASSKNCPVQMFRIKNNIYATQFHPELDLDGLIIRINIYKNHGYFPPESSEDLIKKIRKQKASEEPMKILRNFIEKYRK